jgi:hypothetical protein
MIPNRMGPDRDTDPLFRGNATCRRFSQDVALHSSKAIDGSGRSVCSSVLGVSVSDFRQPQAQQRRIAPLRHSLDVADLTPSARNMLTSRRILLAADLA